MQDMHRYHVSERLLHLFCRNIPHGKENAYYGIECKMQYAKYYYFSMVWWLGRNARLTVPNPKIILV